MQRRDFLRGAGWFVVGAKLLGCGDNVKGPEPEPDGGPPNGTFAFPQGVASGDPRPTSVVLWTRAVFRDGGNATVSLRLEVSEDDSFTTLVVDKTIEATGESDNTVRVLVTNLKPNTIYKYRFSAAKDAQAQESNVGPACAIVCGLAPCAKNVDETNVLGGAAQLTSGLFGSGTVPEARQLGVAGAGAPRSGLAGGSRLQPRSRTMTRQERPVVILFTRHLALELSWEDLILRFSSILVKLRKRGLGIRLSSGHASRARCLPRRASAR